MNMPLILPLMQQLIMIFVIFIVVAVTTWFFLRKKIRFSRKIWIAIIIPPSLITLYIVFYIISNFFGRLEVNAELAKLTKLKRLKFDYILSSIFIELSPYQKMFNIIENDDHFRRLTDLGAKFDNSYDFMKWDRTHQLATVEILRSQEAKRIFAIMKEGVKFSYMSRIQKYDKYELPDGMSKYRTLFRLLSLKASFEASQGNLDYAYSLIGDGFKMLKQHEKDYFLIPALVYIACNVINMNILNSLEKQYGINDKTAYEFIKILDSFDYRNFVMLAQENDFILLGETSFNTLINAKLSIFDIFKDKSEKKWYFIINSPFFYQDYAYSIRYTHGISNLFKEPYWTAKNKIANMGSELKNKAFIPFSRLLCNYPTVIDKVAKIETDIAESKITLALHIYKNNHGQFPETLDVLAPEILKEIPVEPYSGKPFEYKKEGNYFKLSSEWLAEKEKIKNKRK